MTSKERAVVDRLARKAEQLERVREDVEAQAFGGDERESTGELTVVDQHPADVADFSFQRELSDTQRRTDGPGNDVWEDIEKLADEGPAAFTEPVREGPAAADDLAMGDPTSLYFREISRLHLLTADEEIMLAKQIEAGKAATEQLADLSLDDP